MLFFVVSCGRSEPLSDSSIVATPFPTLEVEYGASLSEWEEATQGDSDQSTSETNSANDSALSQEEVSSSVPEGSEAATDEVLASTIGTPFTFENIIYQEIFWEGLIPADYTPTAIMEKYQDQLADLEDGSPEAAGIYTQMQEEFDNAPANELINEVLVRIPGFIAPLNYTEDLITEFLLVPYFGACIHTPPPPANQTVLVTTAEGYGITLEDSYSPVWVMGKLGTETINTDLAAAGYNVHEAPALF